MKRKKMNLTAKQIEKLNEKRNSFLEFNETRVNGLSAILGAFVKTSTKRVKFFGVRFYNEMPNIEEIDLDLTFVPLENLGL